MANDGINTPLDCLYCMPVISETAHVICNLLFCSSANSMHSSSECVFCAIDINDVDNRTAVGKICCHILRKLITNLIISVSHTSHSKRNG